MAGQAPQIYGKVVLTDKIYHYICKTEPAFSDMRRDELQ